jgi:hypothetical protein
LDESSGKETVTQRDLLVEIVHTLKGKGRNESIPKFIISKNSGRPNHPLSTVRLKKERRREAWLLGLKKYFRVHDFSKNLKA